MPQISQEPSEKANTSSNISANKKSVSQSNIVNVILIPNEMLHPEASKDSQPEPPVTTTTSEADSPVIARNGKFEEIPNLLDGFRILNRAPADDPAKVFSLDISGQELMFVETDDLGLFEKLETVKASENALPLARLGGFPALKKLVLSCNSVTSLDLDVYGKFQNLEFLDLSFNNIDHSAQILLGTLPKLRYLDLTNNNIKTMSNRLCDMKNWEDSVIEILLPLHVAALDEVLMEESAKDRVPSAKSLTNEEVDQPQHQINENIQEVISGPAFKNLSVLVLESNKLGTSGSNQYWMVLSHLPNLNILNLNANKITSLKGLIAPELKNAGSSKILSIEPNKLPKSPGFKNLVELHLANNLIATLDDLIGVLFFPNLERLFLEGNPVMKLYRPPSQRKSKETKADDLNIFVAFPLKYKIHICDPCYKQSKVFLDESFVSLRPLEKGGGITRPLVQKKGFALKKQAPIISVKQISGVEVHSKTRKLRRNYKLNDKDVENILATGTIPPLRKLFPLKGPESRTEDSSSVDYQETNNQETEPKENQELSNNASETTQAPAFYNDSNVVEFDPDHKDETFLTGVHLKIENNRARELNSAQLSEELEDDEQEYEYYLPPTIQGSIKALRFALSHPVSYWRVVENSYFKHTKASKAKQKSTIDEDNPFADAEIIEEIAKIARYDDSDVESGISAPANSLWSPSGEIEYRDKADDLYLLAEKGFAQSGKVTYKKYDDILLEDMRQRNMKLCQNAPQVILKGSKDHQKLKRIAALQRAKGAGRLKNGNEFDEMTEMINSVEAKMNAVEINLGTLKLTQAHALKSKNLRKTIPNSTELFSELEHEYSRIASLYVSDAEEIVKTEPLSLRLKKLGLENVDI